MDVAVVIFHDYRSMSLSSVAVDLNIENGDSIKLNINIISCRIGSTISFLKDAVQRIACNDDSKSLNVPTNLNYAFDVVL